MYEPLTVRVGGVSLENATLMEPVRCTESTTVPELSVRVRVTSAWVSFCCGGALATSVATEEVVP